MLLEVLAAVLLGCLAGIFTGLIPGVHINLVSLLLVSASGYLLGFTEPIVLGVFIIAMSITHTFLDAVPSIFLGAPDPDTVLSVLPGHRMLLEGKGFEAVKLTIIGSLLSLIVVIALIPFTLSIVPFIYLHIQAYMGWILIVVCLFMILKETGWDKKFWGFFVFVLSGILGILVLSWPNLNQPLFPILSGLFGLSTLLLSLKDNVQIPKQYVTESVSLPKGKSARAIIGATVTGSVTGLLPGLGSAQAAIIAMQLVGNLGNYAFLVLIGGINTVNFVFSLVALYTLEKARNGAIVAVKEILKSIDFNGLVLFLGVALLAGGIATFLTLYLAKLFSRLITKINYRKLVIGVMLFITGLAFYFSSWYGLLILVVSTAVGMIPALMGVKRSLAMGSLILPVILFFIL